MWSGKFEQLAKTSPTRTTGYENDKMTKLSDQFQAALALEALRGDKTVQVIAWKRQAVENMSEVFSDKVKTQITKLVR